MVNGGRFLRHRSSIVQIAEYHNDVVSSLKAYFSEASAKANSRFVGYSLNELAKELSDRLEETDLRSSLAVLISIESAFRVDYDYRCRKRLKDEVSKSFRAISRTRSSRVSLDQDIFQTWSERWAGARRIIGELRSAFRFRHWLAHGHYWEPKLGRKYDFNSVYLLAEAVLKFFPLTGSG